MGASRSLVGRFFTHQALLVNGTHYRGEWSPAP